MFVCLSGFNLQPSEEDLHTWRKEKGTGSLLMFPQSPPSHSLHTSSPHSPSALLSGDDHLSSSGYHNRLFNALIAFFFSLRAGNRSLANESRLVGCLDGGREDGRVRVRKRRLVRRMRGGRNKKLLLGGKKNENPRCSLLLLHLPLSENTLIVIIPPALLHYSRRNHRPPSQGY